MDLDRAVTSYAASRAHFLKLLLTPALLLCIPTLLLVPGPARAADGARWEYSGERGPEHWGSLRRDYATCDTGRRQSPIDISGAVRERLPAIELRYRPATLRMANNGHTVQIRGDGGNRLLIGKESFRLVQFHFHTPSGDCVEGKCYDMAAHFVHKNEAGQLGVLVVLFRPGVENAAVQPLWERFPERAGREQSFPDIQFDPARVLPADRGYYSFEGSLTVPPCTEGVRWFVLRQPVELSAAQIARFRALFPINNRPVQPLNGRRVRESL